MVLAAAAALPSPSRPLYVMDSRKSWPPAARAAASAVAWAFRRWASIEPPSSVSAMAPRIGIRQMTDWTRTDPRLGRVRWGEGQTVLMGLVSAAVPNGRVRLQ